MCGIAGVVLAADDRRADPEVLRAMADSMRHRGPDGDGVFVDGPAGLAHRRLSIIDLEGGGQPMRRRPDGPVIVYNGELYNFKELRARLEARGTVFRTQSDTEVVLAAYEVFGRRCPSRLRGMFAFAVYDPRDRSLFLARDRLGIKPLYYARGEGGFVFASELESIRRSGLHAIRPDPAALRDLLLTQFIAGPRSFYQGVLRLPPGHTLLLRDGVAEVERYWELKPGASPPPSLGEAVAAFRTRFDEVVEEHLISDVPIGAFLSGGIDSSYVVSCLMRVTGAPVDTFTASFVTRDGQYDEARWARTVARALGTRHHEVEIDEARLLAAVPEVVKGMDEPLADPALIPTYLLSRFAREHVKVVLTGEGADELFAGYPRYRAQAARRRLAGRPGNYRPTFVFSDREVEGLLTPECAAEAAAAGEPVFLRDFGDGDFTNTLLYSEMTTSLPDNLLMKVDKMSMLASLEARVPYLDHRVVESCMALPGRFKLRGLKLKRMLRLAAARDLPPAITARRKHGFTLPLREWFQSPRMRAEARELLAESVLVRTGYLDRSAVAAFARGGLDEPRHARKAWTLFTLEMWLHAHGM